MRARKSIWVFALIAALVATPMPPRGRAFAREGDPADPVARALDEARRALVMGRTEDAIAAYERLHEERPDDTTVFWALAKAYAEAGMERDSLIPLLEQRIESDPDDMHTINTLAQTYARLREHDRAAELWWSVLRNGRPNAGSFAEIGALMVGYRMEAQAAEVFLEGRRVLDNPRLFSHDLVGVFTTLGKYESAFNECANTVREHPGRVSWATNRVELMLEAGADPRLIGRKAATLAAEGEAAAATLRFAGSVLLVLDRFDDALAAYRKADEQSGGDGQELIEFAVLLEDVGRREEARRAYAAVAETYPGTAVADMAGKNGGLLRAALGDPEGAVLDLKAVAAASVESNVGSAALLEAARIELEQLARPRDALRTVTGLKTTFRRRPRRIDLGASLLEVEALIALGDLEEAEAKVEPLAERNAPDEMGENILFLAGYVPFLRKDAERSVERFRAMVLADHAGRLVNDALRLMLVASDVVEPEGLAAFGLFADAHAAWRRGDTDGAAQRLKEIADGHPATTAATESLMLLGTLLAGSGDPEGALAAYSRVVEESDAVGASAEARFRRAEILDGELGEHEAALAEYRALLRELPVNHLSGETRRRIETLTTDVEG